jgi:hypothetical protein
MEVSIRFVVYETDSLLSGSDHLILKKVNFKNWITNEFKTEEEAIQALIVNEMTYWHYLILKEIKIYKI